MRDPRQEELVAFVCAIQPELDPGAARRLLAMDGCTEWVALRWIDQRVTAQSLLDLHLETTAAKA